MYFLIDILLSMVQLKKVKALEQLATLETEIKGKLEGNKQTTEPTCKIEKIITHSKTDVYFKKLTDKEILDYINSENTLDKAGAYAIQGKAKAFVEKIEGNVETVIGLDIEKLREILEKNYK